MPSDISPSNPIVVTSQEPVIVAPGAETSAASTITG